MKIKVVGALIRNDDKILLAQRISGELAGYWEFPGGKVEQGEDDFSAIIREIKEELGVDVVPQKIIHSFNYTYSFAQIELTLIKCALKDKMQEINVLGSHTAVTWVSLSDISLPLAPLDAKIIKYLKEVQ